MSFLRRPFKIRDNEDSADANSGHESDVTDGSLHYVVEKGGNDSGPSYQEATGAPVERSSPLGYAVGPVTIVFLNYLFKVAGSTPGPWQLKGVAVAGYTVATLVVALHNNFAYQFSNGVGAVKLLTLVFIAITGLVVLGGHTKVPEPHANFENSFDGQATAYGLTNALYRIIFSYAGFENAFNVVNEVKDNVQNPVKQIRKYGWISLGIVTVLYILANIAYFAAVPEADLAAAEQIAASLFFTNVFGSSGAGVLPYPRFWASTRPFGTTLGPYLVKYILTIIMIVAPPAGDAFNFIADLQVYPSAFFGFVMSVGLYVVRWRRSRLNLPPPEFKAWDVIIIFNIAKDLYLLIMPWYPPEGGVFAGDVSFWYATYVVAGIGILLGCGVYYWLWIYVVPKARGYRIRQQVLELADGAQSHKLVKVPVADLAEWDATHDHVGRPLQQVASVPGSEEEKKPVAV
ncbi:hypothetical protein COL26b_014223 [Colletotrichum chrysophilum]|uniref:uncharacterized protein n=1 Tax=Colletotrichum chrysophilum TaxID=1836956 RepID=UPI0022FFCFD4|nr:uncharacterized protein COL26b_014223 [Colletotrichum chrysophilum]KAJ0359941.1 hypothetical protein COL26b_014223 [Colletotrichum chrysophilum]